MEVLKCVRAEWENREEVERVAINIKMSERFVFCRRGHSAQRV